MERIYCFTVAREVNLKAVAYSALAMERNGTVDAEQQVFRCKRSARRAAHSLQNILWDAQREGKKIAVLSLDWQNFFGTISQEAFLLVSDLVGFSEEDVAGLL